ncbi:hypothetical protein DRN02_005055 [Sphingomonas paucimobilis]|uniref:hypothetical protein n=1 Tax=Sphingomonas paucimobilis TaxID=13689 RepID=UPI000DE52C28|nr:hypothetical protein [Sphingomonas paucimobilis]QBE91459.1 hypothetical protein DRN02_005055 [Sphingomonas paucimobilis]
MDAHKTPDAVREAVQKGLEFVAVTLAFLGRDRGTDRESKTLDGLAIEARALDPIMREALAALDSRAGDAGEEIENGYTADDAVDFVFNRLASKLGLVDWQVVEGSEEWEGDVSATLHRLLIDAGIIDDETGAVATLATPAPAVDADEGYNPEAKPDRVNITPEHNEALHGALLASSAAVDAVPAGEVLKQQAHEWRRGEVQAIGAAISTRSWHAVEQAYNALRDKMDAAGCWHASAALSHGEADRG